MHDAFKEDLRTRDISEIYTSYDVYKPVENLIDVYEDKMDYMLIYNLLLL